MEKVTGVGRLRELVRQSRREGRSVGFVPTMGALHEGHVSLVRRARAECGLVVVSIFVNPLQFAAGEDLQRYPRSPEEDARLLADAGADILYLPDAGQMYPPAFSTSVDVGGVSEAGEGAVRPGHFRGVATVVAKLFQQVDPDVAYFGRKDLQQVAVVSRMVRDLDIPVRLVVGAIVRDADGLALSSRNVYLSSEERLRAAALPRALFEAQTRASKGERDSGVIENGCRADLERAGLRVDYVEIVDPATMRHCERIERGNALTAAVRVGKTRLIDNVLLLEE
ncbi:MAG TPA: pantoate--beta-alanine ligase [Thermoanaerobaculia bacterium]|nr:pantoate--beta-alanine ligase [Thermoanaerobaculia bacterium]